MLPSREIVDIDSVDLVSLTHKLLGSKPDAEDVAQDTWLLCHSRPRTMRNALAWLKVTILRRALRLGQRDRWRKEREKRVARADRSPSASEVLEQSSLREVLTTLVDRLEEPYREVLRLRYFEGLEFDDIALRTGRSAGTVRSQVKRGLERLRARFGARSDARLGAFALLLWRRNARLRRVALMATVAASAVAIGLVALRAPRPGQRGVASVSANQGRDELGPATTAGIRIPAAAGLAEGPVPRVDRAGVAPWLSPLEGTVVAPDGAPVPDAAILLSEVDGSEARVVARADAAGRYRISGVDGSQLLWAEVPARVPSPRHLLGTVSPGRALDLCIGYPTGTLTGRVHVHEGCPVSGAEVAVISTLDRFETTDQGTLAKRSLPSRVRTQDDGSFQLGHPLELNFRLLVQAPNQAPFCSLVKRVPGLAQELEIVLPEPSTLEGQVVLPDGNPLADARLELVFPRPIPAREARTNGSGVFVFGELPGGPFALRLLEGATARALSCRLEGNLAPGEWKWLRVMLEEEFTLRGRALDAGLPLVGWEVELAERGPTALPQDLRWTRTGADGRFAFPSCSPASTFGVRLFRPGGRRGAPSAEASAVRAGTDEFVLHADSRAPGGGLAGRFLAAGPLPLLAALGGPDSPRLLSVDPGTGEFAADELAPGTHALRAWLPGLGVWEAGEVEILRDARTNVSLRVPGPGSLFIRLNLPPDVSIDDWFGCVTSPSLDDSIGQSVQTLRVDPEAGGLRCELMPGGFVCELRYRGVRYESRPVHILPDATTEESVNASELIPVSLRLELEHPLMADETVALVIHGESGPRGILLKPKWLDERNETFKVMLTPEARSLRVSTSSRLAATLELGGLVLLPGMELRMHLTRGDDGAPGVLVGDGGRNRVVPLAPR